MATYNPQPTTPHTNTCCECEHVWVDYPGEYAQTYCPSCGSKYWVARPK